MKTLFLAAFAALLATIGTLALAAGADPVIGTWQLNASHSKFISGPAPKSQTRTYSQSDAGITIVMKTTTTDGHEATLQATYKLDGKDYPATGSPDYDSLSGKQVNSRTASFNLKRAGKTVGTTTRTVSKDGKLLTSKTKLTSAQGEKTESVMVFDRQ
jgi:hypothetical protein